MYIYAEKTFDGRQENFEILEVIFYLKEYYLLKYKIFLGTYYQKEIGINYTLIVHCKFVILSKSKSLFNSSFKTSKGVL